MKFFSEYKIFNDIESTGLSPVKNDVITSSFIVTDSKLHRLDSKTFRIKPLNINAWDAGAEKIHGITLEQALQHQDTLINILWFLKPFLVEGKYAEFVSHSLNNFDFNFLEWAFRKQSLEHSFWKMFHYDHTTSTVNLCRQKLQLPNNKLNTVCDYFNIPLNHHSSESDTEACFEIYKRLYEA